MISNRNYRGSDHRLYIPIYAQIHTSQRYLGSTLQLKGVLLQLG